MLNQGSRAGREDQTCSRWKPVFETQLMLAGGRSWGFVKQLFAISRRGSLGTQSLWTNIFCNHDLITCAQTVRLGLHRLKQVFQMEEVRQRFMFMARVSKKWDSQSLNWVRIVTRCWVWPWVWGHKKWSATFVSSPTGSPKCHRSCNTKKCCINIFSCKGSSNI